MPFRLLLAGLLLLCAVQARALERDPSTTVSAKGKVEIAFSPWNDPEAVLLKAIGEARERILVQAYLFTSKPLARALIDANRRGVKVEVMLDAEMNRPASPSVLPTLLAAGIPVAVETRYNIAHNKVMIFDPDSPRRAGHRVLQFHPGGPGVECGEPAGAARQPGAGARVCRQLATPACRGPGGTQPGRPARTQEEREWKRIRSRIC